MQDIFDDLPKPLPPGRSAMSLGAMQTKAAHRLAEGQAQTVYCFDQSLAEGDERL